MYPSARLCRDQSAIQTARAEASSLANVRKLATAAAAAWSKEGDAADKREARQETVKAQSALNALLARQAEMDRQLSENPDRGMSDRSMALAK